MGKSSTDHHNAAAEQEFSKLEQVLNQTADDASNCLKLLKKNLSDYDSRHGNHFINTAKSFMQSDMRSAKDTSMDLKHVAHQINKSHKASESEVELARRSLNTTVQAMEGLKMRARAYDEKNGKETGVTGAVKDAVGVNANKEDKTGVFDKSDKNKEDKHTAFLGLGKDDKEKDTGFLGLGKDDKEKDTHGGLFGKSDKREDAHGGLLGQGGHDKQKHGGVFSQSDTVEAVVKSTIHGHFNISTLDHQITAAEKSLSSSPTFIERAKEVVKDKLKSDKSSPTHAGHPHATHMNPQQTNSTMGKSTDSAIAEQEFTKLQAQMHQSAQDTMSYLEALKHNLSDYDHKHHKHHQHLSSSATSFFSDGLDHAKDAVKQLKHVADHTRKESGATEVDTVRSAMEQVFNALADLHKVAHAYDTEHPLSPSEHGDRKKYSTSDSVEWLVSTTRDGSFCGFSALQLQIFAVQKAIGDVEKPSMKERAKEAVHHVTNKFKGESKSSKPTDDHHATDTAQSA
ncbi:hypothetical protein BBJ28_00004686 [Nothophytophthora sp. Chile5]|nr:hypothetical protein BBJ28_00004686 [Nothophytophthora sp. Chile5]